MSVATLTTVLEDGRQFVLEAVRGLPGTHASTKPGLDRWSVLECMEHIVIVEERFMGWIISGRAIEPDASWEKETRLANMVVDRSVKATAPEAARPDGRFRTIEEAVEAFNEARDRTAKMVEQRGVELYAVGVTHPRFGDMNGAELVQILTGHAKRHAAQIREVREQLGC
jgi:uncharacterized damage-inducible protein DinB